MSKKRKRSETSEADSEEYGVATASKKQCRGEWIVRRELNTETDLCGKLFDFLRKYKDLSVSSSCLSEFLFRAPSRRLQADYYEVVTNPIDLLRIQQKLKTGNYKTVQDFLDDIKLLFDNAKSYYSPSCEEYRAANSLEKSFVRHLSEFGFSVGPSKPPSPMSPLPTLTLKISKTQLVSPSVPARSTSSAQRTSSSSESSVGTSKTTPKLTSTGSGKGSSKTTRSKAWIDEYVNSNEPQKVYVALVYNYHDSNGEFIAGVFHALPSQKDYPEYYRVISEPIDLNTIKSNVDRGHYISLKALQDDIILMIKNAHYFNEPGSVLYRKASALRRFVINKGAELERRYQTVHKTSSPLKVSLQRPDSHPGSSLSPKETEGSSRKVPKLSIKKSEEGTMKVQQSQTASEVEDSQSDSSDDELFSDDPGDSGDKEGSEQFLLRIKKDKLTTSQKRDPLAKLLQAKKPPNIQKCQMAVYRSLMTKTDPANGRLICELFRKRPSAKMYPEYYVVINQPIDLKEIRDKIKSKEYSTMEELMASIDLLVGNACTFNEEDSVVYADALVLKQVAQDALKRMHQTWPELAIPKSTKLTKSKRLSLSGLQISTLASSKGPGLKTEVGGAGLKDVPRDVLKLYSAVKEHTDGHGRHMWRTFEKLPLAVVAGDYFTAIKKPIDMTIIHTKLTHNLYPSPDTLFEDINLLCDNAYGYYSREDVKSRDALVLHGVAVKKYQEVKSAEREANPVPDVSECVQDMIREIVRKTLAFKDASGRFPAGGLLNLVATEEFQHPDLSEDRTVSRSLTLEQIEQWAKWGRYTRLDLLQRDVFIVLRGAREEFGSPAYLDSVALERGYIRARDEVCKKGALLWTPAFTHTESKLEAELAVREEKHKRQPPTVHLQLSPPSSPSGSSSSGESSSNSETSSTGLSSSGEPDDMEEGVVDNKEEEEEGVVVDKRDVKYMNETEYEGTKYQVGNVVYVKARVNSDSDPHIVLIESLWKDKSNNLWLDGCWFYRPVETFHIATRKFYEKEVFKSDFRSIAKLSRVTGKCGVLLLRDYLKFQLEGISKENTFVCECRYLSKTKSFKKIKNWSLPGVQPNRIPRVASVSLNKVPSVFAPSSEATPTKTSTTLGESSLASSSRVDESERMEVDEGEGEEDDSPDDELELSFSASLKNITVPSPEPNCTYYEQYCIDGNHFRLGDFVYLRSDRDLPYIARIDKMWTDASNDPWIHGSWYIRPRDVDHLPTRMFHERELFMSNIQDTNPMRTISGKCSVVSLADFCKKRSTQFSEEDVYIAESRYNEAEKKTVKFKGFKHYSLSSSVTLDEVYFFPKEIKPLKSPSPKLFDKQHLGAPTPSPPPASNDPGQSHPSTPASGSSSASTTPLTPAARVLQAQLANAVKRQHGQSLINLNPQLMQQLLASASKLAMSPNRPVMLPMQQPVSQSPVSGSPDVKTSTNPALAVATQSTLQLTPQATKLELATKSTTPGSTIPACTCRWLGCHQEFKNVLELGTHLLSAGIHIIKQDDGIYYCKWKNCHRNPVIGGKPFNSVAKLTRHLREVHLLKISNSLFSLSPLSGVSLSQPSSLPSPKSTPSPAGPNQPIATLSSTKPATTSILSGTPASSSATPVPIVTQVQADDTLKSMHTPQDIPKVPSIFQPPPEDRRKICHSTIYTKYIKGLQSNSQHMSSSKDSTELRSLQQPPVPPKPIDASDWLGSDVMTITKDSSSILDALWALRDHLQVESAKLDKYTRQF